MKRLSCLLLAILLFGCGGGGGGGDSTLGENNKTLASVTISDGNNQTATVGTELAEPLVALLLNKSGSPIAGYVVNFRVVTGGGSVFAGAAISDSNGIVRERWTLGTVAGSQKVEVRAVDSNGTPVVFATFDATAVADAPDSVSIASGNNQWAVQGQPLPLPVKIVVRDKYGNLVLGTSVSFQANDGGAASPGSAKTNEVGEAEAIWTLGIPIGVQTLNAVIAGVPAISFSATATQAPPTEAVAFTKVSGDPQTIEQHLACALTVRVTDVLGNGVSGHSVTFSAAPENEYPKLVTVTTDSSGSATGTMYFHTSGQMQVMVSTPGFPPVMFAVNVTPNGHLYDGNYCGNIVTYGVISPPVSSSYGSVNEADGTISFYSVHGIYSYTGQIVIGSLQHATASGTVFIGSSGRTEPWSCVRE